MAVGWSGNLVTLLHQLGIELPGGAQRGARHDRASSPAADRSTAVFNLPAVLITVAVTALLIVGVSESATVNAVIVVIKVAVVLVVIGAGALFIDRRTGIRSSRRTPATFGEYGWSGILRGAGVIFFAYIGFDAVSTSAQEARNPQRDMPRGILGSLAICTVLFVLVSARDGRARAVQADAESAGAAGASRSRRPRGRAAGTPWAPLMNGVTVLVDARRARRR